MCPESFSQLTRQAFLAQSLGRALHAKEQDPASRKSEPALTHMLGHPWMLGVWHGGTQASREEPRPAGRQWPESMGPQMGSGSLGGQGTVIYIIDFSSRSLE